MRTATTSAGRARVGQLVSDPPCLFVVYPLASVVSPLFVRCVSIVIRCYHPLLVRCLSVIICC